MARRVAEYKFAYLDGGMGELNRLIEFHKTQFPNEKLGLILESSTGLIFRSDGPFQNYDLKTKNDGFYVDLLEDDDKFEYTLKKFIFKHGWTQALKYFNFEVVYVYKAELAPDVHLTYLQAFTKSEQDFVRVRMIALSLLLIFISIGLIIGYTLSRKVILPIRKFIKTIDQIEAGESKARVPVSDGDEFDVLAGEFNKLMDSKDTLVQGINETLDTVAHEIRTPLTRFRVAAEVASDKELVVKEGLEASEQISYLLTSILESSKAQNGFITLNRTHFPVSELIAELTDIYTFLIEEKSIRLEAEASPGISVSADRRLLLQAVNNLLDNAIKYTPAGGKVSIHVREENHAVIIEVSDSGIGISPEEQSRVWERLYRSKNHNHARGYGIGLSVVKSIVELHEGSVSVDSRIGKGSTFTIRLPK